MLAPLSGCLRRRTEGAEAERRDLVCGRSCDVNGYAGKPYRSNEMVTIGVPVRLTGAPAE